MFANLERPLLFASAFDNGLADHKSAFKRFNGNNQATLCPNLVNFYPIFSELTLLKRTIFATIHPNLTTIFIWHVGISKQIGRLQFWFQQSNRNNFCTPGRNLVRFGSVTPEFKMRSCTVGVTWNDLYSLLQHSTTDWTIVNPLSRGSIRLHRVQIWWRWTSVQQSRSFRCWNAQFLPQFARNSTTIFIRHVVVRKPIGRSQFWFQQSNWQSFLYIL